MKMWELFLAVIRLLAEYDVILAEHLQSTKEKPKSVTYFSNRSQNEIIDLGKTIEKKFLKLRMQNILQ